MRIVRGIQRFFKQAGSADKILKIYAGRYHDPLRDIGKEEVIADVLAWINERLSA